MAANFAKLDGIGKLEADFQLVPFVQIVLYFSQYCCEISLIKISKEK